MTSFSGIPYRTRVVRLGNRSPAFDAVHAAVTAGQPCPLYVGSTWIPRHVVLAVAPTDSGVQVYNPARGTVVELLRTAFEARRAHHVRQLGQAVVRGRAPALTLQTSVSGAWVGSELLDVAVERPALQQLQVEVGGTLEDRARPGLTGDDGEDRQLHAVDQAGGHQRPVHRQAAVRSQGHLGLRLQPGDDVDGVATLQGHVRPVEGLLERRRHHRGRHAPHSVVHRVDLLQLPGARPQQLHEVPEGVRPPAPSAAPRRTSRGGARGTRALLAPVAAPVPGGTVGAVAVEGGEDVEGVGRGHVVLLSALCRWCTDRGPPRASSNTP